MSAASGHPLWWSHIAYLCPKGSTQLVQYGTLDAGQVSDKAYNFFFQLCHSLHYVSQDDNFCHSPLHGAPKNTPASISSKPCTSYAKTPISTYSTMVPQNERVPFKVGSVLGKWYKLLHCIGTGSSSTVWLDWDEQCELCQLEHVYFNMPLLDIRPPWTIPLL